jgi:hypothetical protein
MGFMSLGIHSEVEISEGSNLKSIHHFKLDGPLVSAEILNPHQ